MFARSRQLLVSDVWGVVNQAAGLNLIVEHVAESTKRDMSSSSVAMLLSHAIGAGITWSGIVCYVVSYLNVREALRSHCLSLRSHRSALLCQ